MTCGIYAIRNSTTNKVYVGKSINIESRFSGHKSMLRSEVRSKDCNRYLFNAFKKYGEDVLVKEWESMLQILKEHPDYHDKAIYGCCSGTKKSYRGFVWKKKLKEK